MWWKAYLPVVDNCSVKVLVVADQVHGWCYYTGHSFFLSVTVVTVFFQNTFDKKVFSKLTYSKQKQNKITLQTNKILLHYETHTANDIQLNSKSDEE